MPKAAKTKDTSVSSASGLFIFNYEGKRVLAMRSRIQCYSNAIKTCRSLFPSIPVDHTIIFNTKDLAICDNEMVVIAEDTWGMVLEQLNSVVVTVERPAANSVINIPANLIPTPHVKGQRITLNVYFEEKRLQIKISRSATVSRLLHGLTHLLGQEPEKLRVAHYGQRLCLDDTLKEHDMEDGDDIHCSVSVVGGKPVIYLLSPSPMTASVKLSLVPQWELSAIYPVVPIKPRTETTNEEVSWEVKVQPNGDLTELTTGLDVAYLFWEAHTNSTVGHPPVSPPLPSGTSSITSIEGVFHPNSADLSESDSVVLSVDTITPYLDKVLAALCLHTEARTSFITYWLPSFLKHKHVALRFVPQKAYEHAAPLTVSPAPDVITRVFMVFKGIPDDELDQWSAATQRASEDVRMWKDIVGVNSERADDATLFRVLEWGGMEVLQRAIRI